MLSDRKTGAALIDFIYISEPVGQTYHGIYNPMSQKSVLTLHNFFFTKTSLLENSTTDPRVNVIPPFRLCLLSSTVIAVSLCAPALSALEAL